MFTLGLLTVLALVGGAEAKKTLAVNYVQAPDVAPPQGTDRVVLLGLAARGKSGHERTWVDGAVSAFRGEVGRRVGFQVVYVPAEKRPDLSVDSSWAELRALAEANGAQAVVVFDDLIYSTGKVAHAVESRTRTVDGREVSADWHIVRQVIRADLYIRYLDPFAETVLYDKHFYDTRTVKAESRARIRAREQLKPELSRARLPLAKEVGQGFARRITGVWVRRSRKFFAGGKLKAGARYAQVGKWAEARKAWRPLLQQGGKVAMKARYDMAIAHEAAGHPRTALETLDPLVGVWNKNLVLDYHRRLKYRVENREKLEEL